MSKSSNIPTKQCPGFGIIAPIAYLQKYSALSNFHLVLAHLVDTNEEYAAFYREMSNRNDFIICDNGAFELGESYAPDKLIELGHKCYADALVLPDYPFQPAQKTINASNAMIAEVKSSGFQTMFVPQSKVGDLEDWISCYKWAANNDNIDIIGMSILGIPNALPHIPKAYARVVMTQLLIDRGVFNFNKYHHYLGLNAGPNLEIPALIKMNALNSCDSSNPVWTGLCGHMYNEMCDSYLPVSKVSKHVDFNYPMVKDDLVHRAIWHNVNLTQRLFGKYI
jgi:hypothetical protein